MEGNMKLREVASLDAKDPVWAVAWNPGTAAGAPAMLASCSGDKTVRIWQQEPSGSWSCKAVLEDARTVRSCAWSPSGKLLATASFEAITIWGHIGSDFKPVDKLEGHEKEVRSVSWNESETLIATCGRDRAVLIWEMLPGERFHCIAELQGHTKDVWMVQWHPVKDVLVSVSIDNSIKIWAEEDYKDDWQCIDTLNEDRSGHSSAVWALSFNSSGDKMVTCSGDVTLKIWETSVNPDETYWEDYQCWEYLCTLSGYHDRTIFSVHWSSEGVIASGAGDEAICLFVEGKSGQVRSKWCLSLQVAWDIECVWWSSVAAFSCSFATSFWYRLNATKMTVF